MLNTYPCNPFPISSEQLHKGDNEDLQAQINAIKDGSVIDSFGDVETALDTKADNDVIAPEFDAEAGTYEIGDLVIYEGKLYEFTSAHETAGEWDPTEVTEKTVADELSSLESGLNNIGALYHSEFYTDTEVANENVINSITIAETGKYLIMSYIKGEYCWLQKGTSYYPNVRLRNEDGTSYVTFDNLAAGDVIKQVNASGSTQTYIVSELKAVRIA